MRSVRRRGAGEDGRLDLLDVALEALDDRHIVVDDRVEDRPEDRHRALLEQLRTVLEPQPRAVQVARDSLTHRDDEPPGDEDRHLPELDFLAVFDIARSAEYGKHDVAILVLLDLRSQVETLGVLDREIVQPEALLHLAELRRVGLEQP